MADIRWQINIRVFDAVQIKFGISEVDNCEILLFENDNSQWRNLKQFISNWVFLRSVIIK